MARSTKTEANARKAIVSRCYATVDISATDHDFGNVKVVLYANAAGDINVEFEDGSTFVFTVDAATFLPAHVVKVLKLNTTLTGAGQIGAFV